jgi:hypothetical protein
MRLMMTMVSAHDAEDDGATEWQADGPACLPAASLVFLCFLGTRVMLKRDQIQIVPVDVVITLLCLGSEWVGLAP